MIKIVALNNDEEANEEEENIVTREAQETVAESEYIRAVKLKSDGEINLCLHLLQELLQTRVLNENIENNRSAKLRIIKYNCHKNIALILEERFEYRLALQHYIFAILIDSTDVSTLYKFGKLALKLHATDLAEYAFDNCLSRNSTHWSATEGMLQVMNANQNVIGSYSCAGKLCQQNLNNESAAQTIKEIANLFKQNLSFLKGCSGIDLNSFLNVYHPEHFRHLVHNEDDLKEPEEESNCCKIPDLKKFVIKQSNWHSIGQLIVDVYSYLHEIKHDMLFLFNINDLIENRSDVVSSHITKAMSDRTSMNVDTMQLNTQESDWVSKHDEYIMEQPKTSAAEKFNAQTVGYNNYDSDSNLKSEGYEANKAKPRRRCSDLHFLEQWGWHKNRRYTSRKRNERDDVDTSLNGYLRKTLVKYTKISIDDKWPFSKLSGTKIDANNECYECKVHLSDNSFDIRTRIEFETFTNKLKEKLIDLMQLTYKWLKHISLVWDLPMPETLKLLYIDVFKIYMSHFNFSTWNQLSPTNYEASFRICILYLELSAKDDISDNSDFWRSVFYQLLLNIGNCHISASNYEIYQLKLTYLEYLLLNKEHRYEECLLCLKQLQEILEQKERSYIFHLPNLGNVCINLNYIKNLQFKYKRQIDVNNIPKFYEDKSWDKLANIIINNLESSENKYDNESWLKDICAQIEILLQSFWIMASYENCLIWSEKCFHFAVAHYLDECKTSFRCTLLAQIINFVTSYIEAIILNEGFHFVIALKKENLCRMVENIVRILVYQFDGTFEKNSNHGRELNFKRLWVILHQLILREENDSPCKLHTKIDEKEHVHELIPKSFLILFTAHEYLGKRQWCTDDNGEFLQYILDAVVLNLKAPFYDVCRDMVYEYLEQVTYCLFKYPQKKARLRHLEDHEAAQIELSWPKAVQVFDLYRPEDLPEFNSYKLESITSDMEQLLLKIISLMPKDLDPSRSVQHITRFIEGHFDSPPRDSNAFQLPYKVLSLYYLLADFYFKNRDFVKAIKFYTLDLTVNPTRFDSWAGMALSKASKIETKLNGLDPISMETIWEECEEVLRCFECCINLNRFQTLLWIEYGSFSYIIHSCFSRYVKSNAKNIPVETFSIINERKNKILTIAFNCFSMANSLQNSTTGGSGADNSDANDEKWLCQYMLGKISEKRKKEPKVYLNHYLMAANYLYENNATYPIKINHSNPTTLSVEALEVFYRINAAIIKYLHYEKEISRSTGDLINKILKSLSSSPFAYNKAKIDGNSLNILKGKPINKFKTPSNFVLKPEDHIFNVDNKILFLKNTDCVESEEVKEKEKMLRPVTKDCFSTSTSIMSSDASTVESDSESDDSLTENENNTQAKGEALTVEELKLLYRMVIQNIEECATRFPEHYKSIYRLIYHYMNSPTDYRDLALSEQLLLGQYKTSLGNIVNGLFYDRKNNNLFNGIWRIPSSEIDRPGSFSAHLVKCVKIFIKLLFETTNHSILVDLAMNLYKTPDLDKRYITDAERKDLCHQSINYAIHILHSILKKNIDKRNDTETLNLLIDVYKIHKKCVKYMNQKEPMFAELLVDVYKFFIKDKVEYVPDNCNFLDLSIKLCVQEISVQKIMEKSSHTDSATNTSDFIVSKSSEISNLMASRVINIPGFNSRPKFRGSTLKSLPAITPNLSAHNTSIPMPIDLKKNSEMSALSENETQLTGRNPQEFQKFFENFYSKMLQNEVDICSTTALVQQKPINLFENQTTLNTMNFVLQRTPEVSSISENTIYGAASIADKNHAEISNDILLQSQFNSPLSKQHSKPKTSYKNKSIFKPYNRPVYSESSQNAPSDVCNNYKIDILSNHVNVFAAYSNLLHNTSFPQMDFSHKPLETNSKKTKEQISEIPPNSLDPASHFPQTQMRNQMTNQQCINSTNVISPTKTLQEKLAERQKAYQLNETNSATTLPITSTRDKSCDDVIVLD